METGSTRVFITAFVGVFMITLTCAYANHFAAGGGVYSLPSDTSETSVRFHFLGVASRLSQDVFVPVIQTNIQCTIEHKGESMSLRLLTSGVEIDPFTVTSDVQ
jgi:hypothetical protein